MVGNERWAGPAYTNSPPPSAVPLPKFSMKQPRTFSLELSSVTHQLAETTSNQSLGDTTLRPRSSGSPCSVSPPHDQKGVWDVTFATKDLRRMLNLDSHWKDHPIFPYARTNNLAKCCPDQVNCETWAPERRCMFGLWGSLPSQFAVQYGAELSVCYCRIFCVREMHTSKLYNSVTLR